VEPGKKVEIVKNWREFEQLVEQIKRLKIPDARIASPDKPLDTDTDVPREVDVGIHIPRETGEIFIAVECRDRAAIQDVTWVEQLITKKQSIQADILIAVTSSDFTESARKKASIHGIQLRLVRDFRPDEILEWAEATYVTISYVGLSAITNVVLFCEGKRVFNEQLDQYPYCLDGIQGNVSFQEFLRLIWDDNILIRIGESMTNYGDRQAFGVTLNSKKSMFIRKPFKRRIRSVFLEGIAARFIDRYPVSQAFSYESRLIDNADVLVEGYGYNVEGSEALRLLVESETKNATLDINWHQLKFRSDCMKDVITDIILSCKEPTILKSFRFVGAQS
jgi:hypothetical protein